MRKRRMLALLLTAAMLAATLPTAAFAAEEGPPCHPVHEGCGYAAPVEAQPCKHEHDEACGYAEGTPETPCGQGCANTDGDGAIEHTAGCAYAPAVEGMPCGHAEHTEACGFKATVAGQPCGHSCDLCAALDSGLAPGTSGQDGQKLDSGLPLLSAPAPGTRNGGVTYDGLTVTTMAGEAVSQDSDKQIILGSGTYSIQGQWAGTLQNANEDNPKAVILVPDGKTANVTLSGVTIEVSDRDEQSYICAFDVAGATVNLTLAENTNNILKSGNHRAGLQAPDGAVLTVLGDGKLTATGGSNSAGIGGGTKSAVGTITISGSAVVEAVGSGRGAGIGSGGNYSGTAAAGGKITITDNADVTATGNSGGAGIGGGAGNTGGSGGEIAISGSAKVEATGVNGGSGIGGGAGNLISGTGGAGGKITISGNAVVIAQCTSGNGAGIGGGHGKVGGAGGTITLSGSAQVEATGNKGGAGIGGGNSGAGGDISIKETVHVTAKSNSNGADIGGTGIGGGYGLDPAAGGAAGTIEISGGTVVAEGGYLGIGGGNGATAGGDGTIQFTGPVSLSVGSLGTSTITGTGAVTVPTGATLTVPAGKTLTNNGTLTNSGTFTNNGTIDGTGTLAGGGTFGGNGSYGDQTVKLTSAAVTGITPPVAGAAPDTGATVDANAHYTAGRVTWKNGQAAHTGNFSFDTAYTASVTLTPKNAYGFAAPVTGTVNGASADVTASGEKITLSYTFDPTGREPVYSVTVNGGTASPASAAEGASVTITATVPGGQQFKAWTGLDGLTITGGSASTEKVTFTMPAHAVTATASFENKPSDSGGGGGSSDNDTPSATEQAVSKVEKAKDGDTVKVDLPSNGKLPNEILEAAAGKDITLEIDAGKGVTWIINGKDIPKGKLADLDLKVNIKASTIPVTVINALTGEKKAMQIELRHNGPFGFPLTLRLEVGKDSAGLWANLYYYDEAAKTLDYQAAAKIGADGRADIPFSHASSYAVVIDAASHDKTNPNTGGDNPFTDVKESDWFFNAVMYVYHGGIMQGTSATTFSPNDGATHAQLAVILWRMEGSPAPTGGNPFSDVPDGAWYSQAVAWCAGAGLVGGYGGGLFGPGDPISREQLAALLHRYAVYKGWDVSQRDGLTAYADAGEVSSWARDAVEWAAGAGIMGGNTEGRLAPQAGATRAQIAAMLMRLLEKYAPGFTLPGTVTPNPSTGVLNNPQTGSSAGAGWLMLALPVSAAGAALCSKALRRRKKEPEPDPI